MFISDVCNETGLTKKAIGYYEERGLVSPTIDDNGYRIFSSADLESLKKVKLYRELGIGVEDIKVILSSRFPNEEIRRIRTEKRYLLDFEIERQRLLDSIDMGDDIDNILKEISNLNKHKNIKEKLLEAFPGYYGRLILSNFAPYLNGSINTKEQELAYKDVINYLDNVEVEKIPDEVVVELNEIFEFWNDDRLAEVQKSKQDAVEDIEKFMKENAESIAMMEEYKESDEYKNSAVAKLAKIMSSVFSGNEYVNTFIPAMRKLSPEYNSYYETMLNANEKVKTYRITINKY